MSCSAQSCTLQKFQSPDRKHLSSQSGLFLTKRAQPFARHLSCWPSLNLNFFILNTSFLHVVNEIMCTKSPRLGRHSISNSLLSLICIQNEREGEVLESELGSSSGYFIFHEVSVPLNFSLLICKNRGMTTLLISARADENQMSKYKSYHGHLWTCKLWST